MFRLTVRFGFLTTILLLFGCNSRRNELTRQIQVVVNAEQADIRTTLEALGSSKITSQSAIGLCERTVHDRTARIARLREIDSLNELSITNLLIEHLLKRNDFFRSEMLFIDRFVVFQTGRQFEEDAAVECYRPGNIRLELDCKIKFAKTWFGEKERLVDASRKEVQAAHADLRQSEFSLIQVARAEGISMRSALPESTGPSRK